MNRPAIRGLGAAIGAVLATACTRDAARVANDARPAAYVAVSERASADADLGARARVSRETAAMGTRVTILILAPPGAGESADAAVSRAFAELRRLEALMTNWRADSDVSHLNREAGKGPVPVSPETMQVIAKSLWISERSGGVFDITFEAMHGLWKFDQDLEARLPPAAEVARRRRLIDYRQIAIDEPRGTVALHCRECKIGLGGIAKGYAVDRAAQILLAAGIDDFVIQAGGDLYAHGHKEGGSPWVVGVRDPRGSEGDHFAIMPLTDHAFSTAGDYERSFIKDGVRYHHIIDPRTGFPATASRSVTIWAPDALTADALDDAVFILGPARGLPLVESVEGAGAVIVDADNRVWISQRLAGKVRIEHPPSDGI